MDKKYTGGALYSNIDRKSGRWITQWNVGQKKEYYICSECREEFSYDHETGIRMDFYRFCPNCGCKMGER